MHNVTGMFALLIAALGTGVLGVLVSAEIARRENNR